MGKPGELKKKKGGRKEADIGALCGDSGRMNGVDEYEAEYTSSGEQAERGLVHSNWGTATGKAFRIVDLRCGPMKDEEIVNILGLSHSDGWN